MALWQQSMTPGDHPLTLMGAVGPLEANLMVPKVCTNTHVALLGHPHSLQGGTMNNKVVTTLARLFSELGIASLRFNFRGVGASVGFYDAGRGESDDMLVLLQQCAANFPNAAVCFAGFSFGSYVAYRAAVQHPHALLVTVAPALENYDYSEWQPQPHPWLIAQGDADEVVSYAAVRDFANQFDVPLLCFEGVGHFFHGQLIPLKTRLKAAIAMQLGLADTP